MKTILDRKIRKYEISKYLRDKIYDMSNDEVILRSVAIKERKINEAREYYAATKVQAVIRGFIDRVVARRLRKQLRAVLMIQRIMLGKLGKLKWKREYWKSVSVVRSDSALKEILERSTLLRTATLAGRKGYNWKEYFDPLTESFWYFNTITLQNTWQCPFVFQKDLHCPWGGFPEYGDMPYQKPCRCIFGTLEEYNNHIKNAHKWYCVACHQKNSGVNFPKCFVCGNKYDVNGMEGEKELRASLEKIHKKLTQFLEKDVVDSDTSTYNIKDRLVSLAMERKRMKERLMLLEDTTISTDEKKHIRNTLVEINKNYMSTISQSYAKTEQKISFVTTELAETHFTLVHRAEQEAKKHTGAVSTQHRPNLPTIPSLGNSTNNSNVDGKKPLVLASLKKSKDMKLNTIQEPMPISFYDNHEVDDVANDTFPQVNMFDSELHDIGKFDPNQIMSENTLRPSSVAQASNAIEWVRNEGLKGERERFRDPITKGLFTEQDFDLITSIHNDDMNTNLQLSMMDDSDEDDETSQTSLDNNSTIASVKPISLVKKSDLGEEEAKDPNEKQKLTVCAPFLRGECTLSTCPLAHPGLRDMAKPKIKTIRSPEGDKIRMNYVTICPNANGIINNCPNGKMCKYYHVYIRPSTQELILKIYPKSTGTKTRQLPGGGTISGHVKQDLFQGYGILQWRDGSTYLGDFHNNVRHGFGLYRNKQGLEYVGEFYNGYRHGWGLLRNVNGEEYLGEFREGKMEGIGAIFSPNGDIFEGNFLKGKYHGIGMFRKANGDVYMGNCEEGMAHGLGILSLSSGEKYKGYFYRNARHGNGACSYPNGSKYAGEWYRGCHEGFGIYLSPIGEKYIGKWCGGKKQGNGRYMFLNGDFYDGEFYKNKAKGMGVYYHANGNIYTGQWDNDMRNGKGTYQFENGSKYTGHWLNNNIHVKGRFDFANGAFYRGQFDFNTKHGKGIFTWPNGNMYRGEFVHEKLCGKGEMIYINGHRYVGMWADNKKNGYGTMYYSTGPIYEGEWVNDIRQGKGKITFFPGTTVEECYEGDYHNDIWHGWGIYRYKKDEGTVYEGEWVNGIRCGHGTLTYQDGSYYRGDFMKDQMWGKGVYVGSDGTQYDGEWRANMRQGIGTSIDVDGSIYYGEFWGNMKQGKGQVTRNDGSIYYGTWDANIIVGNGKVKFAVGNKEKKDGLPKEITIKVFGY